MEAHKERVGDENSLNIWIRIYEFIWIAVDTSPAFWGFWRLLPFLFISTTQSVYINIYIYILFEFSQAFNFELFLQSMLYILIY